MPIRHATIPVAPAKVTATHWAEDHTAPDIADVTGLQTALDGKASTSHNHTGVYDPAGSAAGLLATHEAASDPHPGYLTATEGNAAYAAAGHDHAGVYSPIGHNHSGTYDPAGTAASAVSTHEGLADPHPQYLTSTEGNAAYAAASHTHAASAIASGTIDTARLGSGTANSTTFLRGDQTWATPPSGPGGQAFPVGAVYINVTGVNPATELGYGTWSAFGAGRVMVGYDAGDTDFDTAEETGGAKTKAISAHAGTAVADHASHTHSVTSNVAVANHTDILNHTHTVTVTDPGHNHTQNAHTHTLATGTGATGNFSQVIGTVDTSSGGSGGTPTQTALGTISGSTTATNVANTTGITATTANPAGGVASVAHSVTNNAVTSAGPSAPLTHSVTQPSDHTALNVLQPFIVCHFWKRTA